MDPHTGEVTRLLNDLRSGKKDAEAQLFSVVYDELRRLAAGYLRRERPDHTLQPTALVHEAYLRLVEQTEQNWQNRAHFLGIGARLMRQILVDHARKHNAGKRGGGEQPVSLYDFEVAAPGILSPEELIVLDDALSKLEAFDHRLSRIVELRFFGGLTEEEISHLLGISVRTVKRDWSVARAWLYAEITK
ncbi:MAG: sigma-70 family RNA polymerase sigma factor [Acidobacteriia bacterium]|nr:sigma-70 family RNA polymerase sigma factor [Terriglobia bacterium]